MTRIAVVQMDCSENQMERAREWVARAAGSGADFVLLPELATSPWLPAQEDPGGREAVRAVGAEDLLALEELARTTATHLIVPVYEAAGPQRHSAAFVIDRAGRVAGHYRKNHIPYEPGWYEKFYVDPGDLGYPVFELEGLRFGIQICWDNMFPEGTRAMALDGADLVFAPRATGQGTLARWRTVLMANAAVNHLYVATANRVGLDRGILFGGDSLVAGPDGELLIRVDPADQPGMALFDLNRDALEASRRAEPYFENRRPDLYRRLVNSAEG